MIAKRANSDRFVDPVQRSQRVGIDGDDARRFGIEIHPAGKCLAERNSGPGKLRGDAVGGLILRHIVGLQAGDDDGRAAGFLQPSDVFVVQVPALFELLSVNIDGMRQDGTGRRFDRNFTEEHGALRCFLFRPVQGERH